MAPQYDFSGIPQLSTAQFLGSLSSLAPPPLYQAPLTSRPLNLGIGPMPLPTVTSRYNPPALLSSQPLSFGPMALPMTTPRYDLEEEPLGVFRRLFMPEPEPLRMGANLITLGPMPESPYALESRPLPIVGTAGLPTVRPSLVRRPEPLPTQETPAQTGPPVPFRPEFFPLTSSRGTTARPSTPEPARPMPATTGRDLAELFDFSQIPKAGTFTPETIRPMPAHQPPAFSPDVLKPVPTHTPTVLPGRTARELAETYDFSQIPQAPLVPIEPIPAHRRPELVGPEAAQIDPKTGLPRPPADASLIKTAGKGLASGVSSIVGGVGGVFRMVSLTDPSGVTGKVGEALTTLDTKIQEVVRPAERVLVDAFDDPSVLKDPEWWAYTGGQAVGSMLGFALPAGGGAVIGSRLAAAGARSPLLTKAFQVGGFLAGGTVAESLIEGGIVFNEAKAAGKSDDEAAKAAAATAAVNVPLIAGTSALGYGRQLLKFGGAKRAAEAIVDSVFSGLTESVQEVGQQVTSNIALGRPPLEGVGTSAIAGWIGGGVVGGGLEAIQRAGVPLPTIPSTPTPVSGVMPEAVGGPSAFDFGNIPLVAPPQAVAAPPTTPVVAAGPPIDLTSPLAPTATGMPTPAPTFDLGGIPSVETGRKYSSTQIALPEAIGTRLLALGKEIPETDLADDGRETTPHVTVKFGIHTEDAAPIRVALANEPPITVALGKTSIFPASESGKADVLKVDVDSPDLYRLNQKIAQMVETTDTHPTYQPHATIAYLKPGTGKRYVDNEALKGESFTIDHVTFTTPSGQEIEIPLGGQIPPAVAPIQQTVESAQPGTERVTRPDGRLEPVVGESVYQMVPGFGGTPAYIHGEVFKAKNGNLRVRVTGSAALVGSGPVAGKTYPLDAAWTVQGDPEVKRREKAREQEDRERREAIRREQAESDARVKASALQAIQAEGHRPLTADVPVGSRVRGYFEGDTGTVTETSEYGPIVLWDADKADGYSSGRTLGKPSDAGVWEGYSVLPDTPAATAIAPTTAASLALQIGNSPNVRAVESLEDAARLVDELRDRAEQEGMGGASQFPTTNVVDTRTGQVVARISYNGRIWDPATGKELVERPDGRGYGKPAPITVTPTEPAPAVTVARPSTEWTTLPQAYDFTGVPVASPSPANERIVEAETGDARTPEPRGDRPGQPAEPRADGPRPAGAASQGALGTVLPESGPPTPGPRAARPGRSDSPGVVAAVLPDQPRTGEEPATESGDRGGALSGRPLSPTGAVRDPGPRPLDYDLTPDRIAAIIGRGPIVRARDNLAVIRIVQALRAEQRYATPAEQEALAKYVGWGASDLAAYLDTEPNPRWSASERAIYDELQQITTEDERKALAQSTPYAHFTYDLFRPIWDTLAAHGFTGGRVLEPAVGTGHAFGFMPPTIRQASTLNGVELEPITATIAQALYPSARIQAKGYEAARIAKNTQDLVVGNPPFGKFGVRDPQFRDNLAFLTERIHNYFFAKALDHTRPGGLVVFITTHFTMDSPEATKTRRYLMSKAHFVGAVRLPNTAFDKSAKTEVVTDVIVLRKLAEGEREAENAEAFIETPLQPDLSKEYDYSGRRRNIYRSAWYDAHPELILGTESTEGTMRGPGEYTVTAKVADVPGALGEALAAILPPNTYRPATTSSTTPEAETAVAEGAFKIGELRIGPKGQRETRIQQVVDVSGTLVNVTPRRVVNKATGATAVDETAVARITGLIGVRDALRRTIATMRDPSASDAEVVKAQHALQTTYRAFVKRHGVLTSKANQNAFALDPERTNLLALEIVEPKATVVDTPKGKVLKVTKEVVRLADIFTKRTVHAEPDVTRVETPKDALLASLAVKTVVDWPYMARLTGQTVEELQAALKDAGQIYEQPDESWVVADEYLSGDVVTKLEEALAAAEEDPRRWAANIEALKAIQPAPKTRDDINAGIVSVGLGAHWVPVSDLKAFVAQELPGLPDDAFQASLIGTEAYVRWAVKFSKAAEDRGLRHPLAVPYGPKDSRGEQPYVYGFTDLLSDALNLQMPDLGWWEGRGDDRHYVKDPAGTRAARANLEELRQQWMQWVFAHEDVQDRVLEQFNTRYNRTVQRTFDGSHLANFVGWNDQTKNGTRSAALPGLALPFPLYPHQLNAIWRALTSGNTLLAHEVGAGKTFEMIVTAMEMRRTGRARKPMIAVPTNLLAQWKADVMKAYPAAKLLAFDEQDLAADKRQTAMARIAYGDWDIVLVPHSSFGLLKVSDQRMVDFMQTWVDELVDAEREARSRSKDGDRDMNVKALAAARRRLEDKIAKKMDAIKEGDKALTWEDLGVDALLVDEAHAFKNLYFFSKMDALRGLSRSESNRALDLFVKIQDLNEQSNYRNLIFGTATPVMNSIVEIFTMQRYLQPQRLRELGFENFDNWYTTFAAALPSTEQRPDGTYQEVMRVRDYRNLQLLYKVFAEVMDYVGWADMPYLKLPKVAGGRIEIIETEPHPMYGALRQWFADRLEAIRQIPPHVKKDGTYIAPERMHPLTGEGMGRPDLVLTVMNDAKKAAIDARLVLGDAAKDVATSRLQIAARRIADIYRAERAKKGAQLVFLDMGTPSETQREPLEFLRGVQVADETEGEALGVEDDVVLDDSDVAGAELPEGEFNLYDALKQALIARGVPSHEIAFIHQARNAAERLALFQAVNDGKVRVLFASTDKGGVGMNVQQRLAAVHHIDAPRAQRPGDIRQRDGRGIRQGNTYPEIHIVRYVTKGTTDEWLYGLLNTKSDLITKFMRGEAAQYTDEDPSTMSIEEAQIRATGDPRGIELTELRAALPRLQAQAMAADRAVAQARGAIERAHRERAHAERDLVALRTWMPKWHTKRGDQFSIQIGKSVFTKRPQAEQALAQAISRVPRDRDAAMPLGEIGGLSLDAKRYEATAKLDYVRVVLDRTPLGQGDADVASWFIPKEQPSHIEAGMDLLARIVNAYEQLPALIPQTENTIQRAIEETAAAEAVLSRPNPAKERAAVAEARIAAIEEELRQEGAAKDAALKAELKGTPAVEGQEAERPRYRIREMTIAPRSARGGPAGLPKTSTQNPDLVEMPAGASGTRHVAGVRVGDYFVVHKIGKQYELAHIPTGSHVASYAKRPTALAVAERLATLGGDAWNNPDRAAVVKGLPVAVRDEAQRLRNEQEADAYATAHPPTAKPKGKRGSTAFAVVDPISAAVVAGRELWAQRQQRRAAERTPLVASAIPEVEERWQSSKGVTPESIRTKARDALDALGKLTRHFPEINPSRSMLEATAHELLLEHERAPKWAQAVAHNRIAEIVEGLAPNEADLLARALALPDILKDLEEGLYTGARELPFGYTSRAQVEADLAQVQAAVTANPKVQAALGKRQAFVRQLTQDLVDAKFLPAEVLEDERYYHRQVLAYFNAAEYGPQVGATKGREVRQRQRGFQKGRVGGGDFNTRYIEAEFEWVAQALSELKTKSTLEQLKALFDRARELKALAKRANRERLGEQLAAAAGLPADAAHDVAEQALKPYQQRIAYSIAGVMDALAQGEYQVSDALREVAEELGEAYQEHQAVQSERDPEDREPFRADHPQWWALMSALVEQPSEAGRWAASLFKAIRAREDFLRQSLGREYVNPKDPESLERIAPEGYVRWQPEPGNHFFKAQSVDGRILEAVATGDKEAQDLVARTVMALGGPRETWIIPDWLAATLTHFGAAREAPGALGALDRAWRRALGTWKQQVLLFPSRIVRYNLNNATGDADAAFAYAPGIFRKVPEAAQALYHMVFTDRAPGGQTRADLAKRQERLIELGVIDAGLTALEIPEINTLPGFRRLAESDPKTFMESLLSLGGGIGKYYHFARTITQYRENLLRLAAYDYLLEQVRSGKPHLYGASNPAKVDALRAKRTPAGQERTAALLARDLIGDYQGVSAFTQFMRARTLPFFSFQEINFKRYLWLFRNAIREGQTTGERAGQVGRTAAAGGVRVGLGLAKRALLVNTFLVGISLWNKLFFPDEDDELRREGRQQLHLITGRYEDGTIRTTRVEGAFSDFLEWVGLHTYPKTLEAMFDRDEAMAEFLVDMGKAAPNKIVQLWEPFTKQLFEQITKRRTFPNIFRPTPIRDRAEHLAGLAALDRQYAWITGKPSPPGNSISRLFFYRRDPGEAMYADVRNQVQKWLEARGKERSSIEPTAKSNALYWWKRAVQWGDQDAAMRWMTEYRRLGGTAKGLTQSVRMAAPLGGLNARDQLLFRQSLTPERRATLLMAEQWYRRVYRPQGVTVH